MNKPVFNIARVTLQNLTSLSIATGKANGIFDTSLVVDANGLPAIPGSSLAGVLRHLYHDEHGEDAAEQLFGFQDKNDSQKSQPSALNVSWGCMQNTAGNAIQGLALGNSQSDIEKDPILKPALAMSDAPVNRDRVKINHRGTAAKTGKFDRAVLPAGYRFTVEFSMWSDDKDSPQWNQLLDLLHHPLFRLGGSTRAGLGKLKVISIDEQQTDLTKDDERKIFTGISADMNDVKGWKRRTPPENKPFTQTVSATIKLKPNSYWRIGQGDKAHITENGKTADLLPKLEQRVTWENGSATAASAKLLIPGSSVKGALSHRIAFHANRFSDEPVWADDMDSEAINNYDKSENCEAVKKLFGFASDNKDNKQVGQAGHILIDDAWRDFSASDLQMIMHNSIDRFSGSVRDHMLFSEEMVWGKDINLEITVKKDDAISSTAKKALQHALDDLCQGRLAIGAGVSKGHGLFTGEITWSDKGKWIGETA